MILKQIAIKQRPRERMKEKGIESLNDAELLAILLERGGTGVFRVNGNSWALMELR